MEASGERLSLSVDIISFISPMATKLAVEAFKVWETMGREGGRTEVCLLMNIYRRGTAKDTAHCDMHLRRR